MRVKIFCDVMRGRASIHRIRDSRQVVAMTTPHQHTPSQQPLNTPSIHLYTTSTHAFSTASEHPINTSIHHINTRLLNPPSQPTPFHTLSIHPLNPLNLLNPPSRQCSPMHMASLNNHVHIVEYFVETWYVCRMSVPYLQKQ